MHSPDHYHAACSAVLAGSGKTNDNPPPDRETMQGLRWQGLHWLRFNLATWSGAVGKGMRYPLRNIIDQLRGWQRDPDLACVRDADELAQLSEGERKRWQEFWAEVRSLIAAADRAHRSTQTRDTPDESASAAARGTTS
jgi:hypothetical protein